MNIYVWFWIVLNNLFSPISTLNAANVFLAIQGNKQNQEVIVNCKVIDYTNFVLRLDNYADCSADQVTRYVFSLLTSFCKLNNKIIKMLYWEFNSSQKE